MHAYMNRYGWVPEKRHQMPIAGVTGNFQLPNVGAGNQIQICFKNSTGSFHWAIFLATLKISRGSEGQNLIFSLHEPIWNVFYLMILWSIGALKNNPGS